MNKTNRLLAIGITTITVAVLLTSCQLGRFVFYNFADITDHKKFQARQLHNNATKFSFQTTEKPSKELKHLPSDKYLEDNKTVGLCCNEG